MENSGQTSAEFNTVGQAFGLVDGAGKSTVLGSFTTVFGADYNEADGLNDAEKYGQLLARLSGLDARNGGDINLTLNQLLSEINSGGVSSAVLAQMLKDGAAIFESGPNAGLATLMSTTQALLAPSNYNVAAAKAMTDAGDLADGLLNGLEAARAGGTTLAMALPGHAVAGGQVTLTLPASGNGTPQTVLHTITLADVVQGYVSLFVSEAQLTASGEGVKVATSEIANAGGATLTVTAASFRYDASAPNISMDAIAGDNTVNLAEKNAGITVSGTVLGAEAGQTVLVVWGNSMKNVVLGSTSGWHVVFSAGEVPADDSSTPSATATVTDVAGNIASAAVTIIVDTAAPTLTIDNVTADNTISAAEKLGGVNVSGATMGVEDGQTANVTWGVTSKTVAVLNNLWSAIFTSGEVPADGNTTITADIHDLAGNPAGQYVQAVTVATGLPSITVNPVTGDDRVNLVEKDGGVTISGTTDIEDGREITVQWGGAPKIATITGSAWHVDYSSAEVPADGSVNIIAHGTNLAGDVAIEAIKSVTVDATEPLQPMFTLGSGVAGGATSAEATQASGVVTLSAESGASVSVDFTGSSGAVTKMLLGTGAATAVMLAAGDLATLGEGTVNVSSVAIDSAGNPSIAANTSFMLDTTHPTVAITSTASLLQTGETTAITFTFSEDPGSTFVAAGIAVTGGEIGETSGTGLTRTAIFTPAADSTDTATVSVANGKFTDAAGNLNSDGGDANNIVSMAVDTTSTALLTSGNLSSGFPQYADHGVFPGL